MRPHPAQFMPDRSPHGPAVEVIRGRKARFTVLRQVEDTSPGVDVARLVRALLTLMMLSSTAGAASTLLIHSDGWRHHLPPPMARAVGQARSALLHVLHFSKLY